MTTWRGDLAHPPHDGPLIQLTGSLLEERLRLQILEQAATPAGGYHAEISWPAPEITNPPFSD